MLFTTAYGMMLSWARQESGLQNSMLIQYLAIYVLYRLAGQVVQEGKTSISMMIWFNMHTRYEEYIY